MKGYRLYIKKANGVESTRCTSEERARTRVGYPKDDSGILWASWFDGKKVEHKLYEAPKVDA
jgi:hypothetical protein